jgi:general secretion pathway protein G
MSKSFKRAAAAGFTLIELLIVVIILAILAAIAIPQFSASSADAKEAALDANLAAVRTALEQYRIQHGGKYPGAATSEGSCANSSAPGTGKALTAQAMYDQLMMPSNAAGETCAVADTNFKYGPYLRQGIPVEPVSASRDLAFDADGGVLAADSGGKGWAYSPTTGQFIKNNSANDSNSRAYSLR